MIFGVPTIMSEIVGFYSLTSLFCCAHYFIHKTSWRPEPELITQHTSLLCPLLPAGDVPIAAKDSLFLEGCLRYSCGLGRACSSLETR